MKTFFLETNAINQFVQNGISGNELSSKSLACIVSIHTTYELARTFLNDSATNQEIGEKLFLFVRDLNPIFTCETKVLIAREIAKLQNGNYYFNYFIDDETRISLVDAIENLSKGIVSGKYRDFIRQRENSFNNDNEWMWDRLIKEGKKISSASNFKSFVSEFFKTASDQNLIDHIFLLTDSHLSDHDIRKFRDNISSYPALKILILSNLYLNFLVIKNANKPGKDKTDDFRHLVDSSYCSAMISNDRKFKQYAAEINPEIEFMTLDDFLKKYNP